MSSEAPTLISHRAIAAAVRFRQHSELSACWVWQGPFNERGLPGTRGSRSMRQDVFERIRGVRPGGRLTPVCGVRECVNPHHMEQAR